MLVCAPNSKDKSFKQNHSWGLKDKDLYDYLDDTNHVVVLEQDHTGNSQESK